MCWLHWLQAALRRVSEGNTYAAQVKGLHARMRWRAVGLDPEENKVEGRVGFLPHVPSEIVD